LIRSTLLGLLLTLFCNDNLLAIDAWETFDTLTQASLRGLVAIDDKVAWACGSKGTIVRTQDGGHSWQRLSIPGLDSVEIRSIHAWDFDSAIVATAGQPAQIHKTTDGGSTWVQVYEHRSPQAFFDGMRFSSDQNGLAFSDPIEGKWLILQTQNRGDSWQAIESTRIPEMAPNEAGFAASNSSLNVHGDFHAWIGLGGDTGTSARVLRTIDAGLHWSAHTVTPIPASESAGIFSVSFANPQFGIAVGGNYREESVPTNNIALSHDGGLTWVAPNKSAPRGFRSAVAYIPVNLESKSAEPIAWITCGPSGCDISLDGNAWTPLSDVGFHTLYVAPNQTVWAAGSHGRIGRLPRPKLIQLVNELN
jgi:photosystem II stability/assembly factor-like uncharacterized protein